MAQFEVGKFELDNLLSEKRILTLTGNGGIYQLYHFRPQGDGNIFGQMGDNQLGLEVLGHSFNDRTRYSASLLSSNDGKSDCPTGMAIPDSLPAARLSTPARLEWNASASTPWSAKLQPHGSLPAAESCKYCCRIGNKSFSREGFVGLFYFGPHVDLTVVTQHGADNAWFGQGYGDLPDGVATLNNTTGTTLPAGSQNPTWNGVFFEPHYVYSPQLIFIGRYETTGCRNKRMETPDAATPSASNFGNISTYTIGYRYNPFMTSRAGFAWHNEYNWLHQDGTGPTLGLSSANINTSEILMGFDFDF